MKKYADIHHIGDKRTRCGFLLVPKTLRVSNRRKLTRWWEHACWVEEYQTLGQYESAEWQATTWIMEEGD